MLRKVRRAQANGFLNSKGISKYVPPAYTHLTKEFYEETVRQAKRRRTESLIDIREWRREGWTYHAKGVSAFDPPLTALSSQSDFSSCRYLADTVAVVADSRTVGHLAAVGPG